MTFLGLAARNLLRNKVRTVLTVMGVAISVVTFLLLRTAVAAWTASADFAAKDRLVTRHKVTFVMTLPKRYIDTLRVEGPALGVKSATFANWFGGKDPNHDTEFFATLAVDSKSYFEVVPEVLVPKDQLQAYMDDRTGAVVGDVLAQKLGWTVGQKVTLESGIYPSDPDKPWTFTVRAIYTSRSKNVDRSTFLFHWDYLNDNIPQTRRDEIGWIISHVDDPSRTAAIALSVDKLFDEKDIQTLSQDEHAFNQSFLAGFSAVLTAFDIISVVILAIMMLVLGNTIAMGVRERTNEIATMRAIGFLPKHIALFVLGEAAVLGLVGGLVGLALAYPIIERGLGRFVQENLGNILPFFDIPPLMTVVSLALAVGLALIASIFPAIKAARLPITDGLRRLA